jgi:hypothetical protein
MKKISVLLIMFLVLFACNSKFGNEKNSDSEIMGELNMFTNGRDSESYAFSTPTYQANKKPDSQKKVIKTSHLVFETKSVEKTYQGLKQQIELYKGFIQNDNTSKDYNKITRRLVVRIPTQNFQPVIDSIAVKVKTFDTKSVSLKDVTEEFIDLEARLKAKKALESRYIQLLVKAKNVKEMLEIEREIAKIREEIEAKQGRLQYLQNKVAFSTINLEFYEYIDVVKAESKTYFSQVMKALKGGFSSLGIFILNILYLWPLLIISILLFVFIRRKIRKRHKK